MKHITILFLIITLNTFSQELENKNKIGYQENLEIAAELFLSDSEIPEDILLNLVPKNNSEFSIFYGTTGPESKLYETSFFYDTTRLIFEKVIDDKREEFYLPSLHLASFADGEFFELFVYYLKEIINHDKEKFCNSVKGKKYTERNPIKYYYKENDCEK